MCSFYKIYKKLAGANLKVCDCSDYFHLKDQHRLTINELYSLIHNTCKQYIYIYMCVCVCVCVPRLDKSKVCERHVYKIMFSHIEDNIPVV